MTCEALSQRSESRRIDCTPSCSAHSPPLTPESSTYGTRHRTGRPDPPQPGRRSRSRAAVSPSAGPTSTAPYSNWPTPATFPPDGPVEPASATPVSRQSCPGTSPTPPTPWKCPDATRRSSAAPDPTATWYSTSDPHRLADSASVSHTPR